MTTQPAGADLLLRSAEAHLSTILAQADSSYSLDRGTDDGSANRERLAFHAEAALRDLAKLTPTTPARRDPVEKPPPAFSAVATTGGPGRPGGPPAPGAGANPRSGAGAEEPTPGSAVALGIATRESPAAVVARGAGADLHHPGEIPGTSAIAELINRNVRRGRHHA